MQDPIFARAKRGDLPSALSIADVCRLSTASVEHPLGCYSPGDDLARHLHQLVALGLVTPERSEPVLHTGAVLGSIGGSSITTGEGKHVEHFVTAASLQGVLPDLGAVGPLLKAWIYGGKGAAPVQAGEPWHRARVRSFCEAVLRGEVIDQDKPPFTAMDIALAMKRQGLWRRDAVEHWPDDDTLRRYVAAPEAGGQFFVFATGRPTFALPPELRVERLIRAYEAGQKPDGETGSNRVASSNFQASGGR